jgi:hypothetical protein
MRDLVERLTKVAVFYEREAAAFDEPQKCRNLGPEECKAIAALLRDAIGGLNGAHPHG